MAPRRTQKEKTVANQPGLDPTLPAVSITINGETFSLCYDFNSIARVEMESGINLLAEGISERTFTSPSRFRAVFWASCLKDRPDMTLEEAGTLVGKSNFADLVKAVLAAWFGSLPESEADPKELRRT